MAEEVSMVSEVRLKSREADSRAERMADTIGKGLVVTLEDVERGKTCGE